MAQCKSCKKVGFFFNVPKYGICIDCLSAIKTNYELILPVIQELIDLAEFSKDMAVITSNIDLAIQHTRDMMNYDTYGIYDLQQQLDELLEKKQSLIYGRFVSGYKEITAKTDKPVPVELKKNMVKKLKSELQKYYPVLSNYQSDLNDIHRALDFELSIAAKKTA